MNNLPFKRSYLKREKKNLCNGNKELRRIKVTDVNFLNIFYIRVNFLTLIVDSEYPNMYQSLLPC